MSTRNALTTTPPYPVEQTIRQIGANLRTARLRRNLSIEQVAEIIGAGPRAIRAAEQGRVSTGVGVYIALMHRIHAHKPRLTPWIGSAALPALLWAYDLLDPALELADPGKDETGLSYLAEKERQRARARNRTMLDNDF